MVRIRIGAGWRDDPELRTALARGRAAPAHVVDAVAIEVDGVDIGAGRTEAELLPALEGLVTATARLVGGARRAAVHFAEGGLELLLRRRGGSALLTLVSMERPSRVLASDVEVELPALARAAREAGEALVADLSALGPEPRSWAGDLRAALARLAAARPAASSERPPVAMVPPPPRRRARAAPSCGFELHDEEGLLGSYEGDGADLGSLLVRGRVWIRTAAGEEVVSLAGAPFLLLRDLAALGRRIAATRRSRERRVVEAVLAGAGRARLPLAVDVAEGTVAAGGAPLACPPLLLARALLEAALDLCGAAVARSPRQAQNPYVVELQGEAAEALRHVEELLAGDRVGAAGAPLRARSARLPRDPLAPGRMRRVAFRRTFEADVGAPAGRGLLRAGELVVAAGAAAILGLEAATGAERWRAEGAQWAGRAGDLLLAARDGAFAGHDLGTGRLRWARASPAPRAAARLRGGALVVASGAGLTALDPTTGRVRWRFAPPAARALHLGHFGPLALAASDTGFLYAVDADGRLAWRLHLPGPPVGPPQPLVADGLVLCSTELGGALVRFDAATGLRRFEAALDFGPAGPAVPFAGLIAVCGSVGGDPVVAAVDDRGALAWTDAAPLPGPLAAGALPSSVVVKTAGGACAAIGRRGELLWSSARESPHPPPANLAPVAARRLVLVAGEQVTAHDAATGAALGVARLGAPVRLLVGADLALHAMDAEGLVLAARVATHLSVL
jgi:outer membrane protein assembly factor BamB